MDKKKLEAALKLFEMVLSDDESQKAISVLKKKISALKSKELVAVKNIDLNALTVPVELVKDPTAFAVFSDGACRGNPGPGAWGCLGQNSKGDVVFEASGVSVPSTNNKMELTGAIESIKKIQAHIKDLGLPKTTSIHLFSDSKYLVDGIKLWVPGWKKRGWKKADKKSPENLEIWKEVDSLNESIPNLSFHWVKGHAGHPQNERCDELANIALDESGF